ncbi:uncharacterized protein B0H18DRAFT_978343 [Fomitopsis serialis]|uniref:uncharacterized protein n=1 Tax=Fomitopsis serialis TaxID=139415 RepID=UPI0020076902|nr:uncharacterized protein B0H18DRAFT_978343 [Neoantrodia serialis]KAH9934798.1 hypothetical protein B0H18DRAFT_978343 [Neoantrodia serialis]
MSEPFEWEELCRSLPFHRLQSFSCWDVMADQHILSLLWSCPDITVLELIWDQMRGLPDFRPWPRLAKLRLHFADSNPPSSCVYPSTFPSYDMLTTLMVFEEGHSSWLCAHIQEATFPRLRVISLQHTTIVPQAIYQFIHRHPTLLEVNVSMYDYYNTALVFEGLLKLIDGTGNWGDPNDPSNEGAVDIIDCDPDGIPPSETFITFTTFAFSRVPLAPLATEWRDWNGSAEPRYTVTTLAMEIKGQDEWEYEGFHVTRLHGFLENMAPRFPKLEVLRLGYHTDYTDWSFCGFMEACAASLKQWPKLRKLAFCWGDLRQFVWRAGQQMHRLGQVEPPVNLPYALMNEQLDNIHSRYLGLEEGFPYTLEHIRLIYGLGDDEVAKLIEDIADVLNESVYLDEAMDDPHLVMRAWQGFCERQYVEPMMRAWARCCPMLEEIEWYPVGPFYVDYPVRWMWKVYRERDGRDVRRMTGELTYKGCPRGNAPPFEVLVGQELDNVIRQQSTVSYES